MIIKFYVLNLINIFNFYNRDCKESYKKLLVRTFYRY